MTVSPLKNSGGIQTLNRIRDTDGIHRDTHDQRTRKWPQTYAPERTPTTMRNDHRRSGQLGMPAAAAVPENPAHASEAVSVSEAAALNDAVQLLLIRTEALLDAAEQCRCRPSLPVNVLVPVHKGMV